MQTRILIIGAGFAGAATAYSLKQAGETDVLILEKEAMAGVHSSGRNAAMIRAEIADPDIAALAVEGRDLLVTGRLAAYEPNGAMLLGHGDTEVSERFPLAHGHGRWCPEDGVVDIHALLQSYLQGIHVRYNTELLAWKPAADGLQVETTQGPFSASIVVNAAGSWAGPLGQLPLTPTKRHIFVSSPMPQIDPHWPFVWDDQTGLYFRPESGGLLLSCCDETPCEPGDYREDEAVLEQLAQAVADQQPGLGDIAIASRWAGHRTFAPDRKFVIGFDPRVEGLFHVAALGGHGVTTSPAYGRIAANLILGQAAPGPNRFSPTRIIADRPIHT